MAVSRAATSSSTSPHSTKGDRRRQHAAQHTPPKTARIAAAQQYAPAATGKTIRNQRNSARSSVMGARQLDIAELLKFERDGWCLTPAVLPEADVLACRDDVLKAVQSQKMQALKHRLRVLCPSIPPSRAQNPSQALQLLQRHATDQLGFLQFFHLHRTHPGVRALVLGSALGAIAAQLLGAKRVRLYQDCAFLKEPGFAETNWHSDLRMAPFDTNAFVTAWVPLRPIRGGEGDSGLQYACASHRDFALPFWHDLNGRDLSDRGYKVVGAGAMQLGDVAWHHGWTLHCAPPQPPGTPPRLALAVCFFQDGARLLARKTDPTVYGGKLHDEDRESWQGWIGDLKDGAVARHPLLPVVHPQG